MFRWLRGLPANDIDRPPSVQHAKLGNLAWDEDTDTWVARLGTEGGDLTFRIGGIDAPDSRLLDHALDIVGSLSSFREQVAQFLIAEADAAPKAVRDEIGSLAVDEICLFWPDRPDDGMIYFSGGKDFRLWRSDYVARHPRQLGYDS